MDNPAPQSFAITLRVRAVGFDVATDKVEKMIATLNECFNGDLEVSVEIGDAPAADGDGAPPPTSVADDLP